MIRTLLLILLAALAAPAAAQTFPKFTGFVVDSANILPPEVESDLTAKLDALQRDTKRQLIVATVPDTQGYPLQDYGYRLGRAWSVGLKDADNGAILFVAPGNPAGQRGPRLEVGYGLEPILTDALSFMIIEGAARIEIAGGATLDLEAGGVASLPAGTATTWHITAPFREFWVMSGPSMEPEGSRAREED